MPGITTSSPQHLARPHARTRNTNRTAAFNHHAPSLLAHFEIRPGSTFCVVNLGCKVNRVESDTFAAALISQGMVASELAAAQLIIVNTCTVTAEADKKARKAVRHALGAAPRAHVVVTGCGVAIDAEAYSKLGERVIAIERADLLAALTDGGEAHLLRVGADFRTRVSLKVQDGCDHACTYCIVHVARGPARSAPAARVVDEARRYFEAGVKELVLAGIDLGSYKSGEVHIAGLLSALLDCADRCAEGGSPAPRIRASSLEPHSINDDFVDLLARADGRLCRHVHLPLQSGSSKVLREMGRDYTAESFVALVDELYERIPTLSITTDIICGFPGETDADFEETLEVARHCRFSKIHVFPYSKREGTPAARRLDQVDAALKADRASRLRDLARDLRAADLGRRAGSKELVLVEGTSALTESYHEICAPQGANPGSLVEVTL